MKKLAILLGIMLALGFAGSALALDVAVHGDLNNRFNLYTNQSQVYKSAETIRTQPVQHNANSAFWGDIKYRIWTELGTNDGKVKGVYAIELGAIRFGDSSRGGGYSGDGVNIETRWAYTDFQLPFVQQKARVTIGLQPFTVNHYVWQETAMGVQLAGEADGVGYKLAWMRGKEWFPTTSSEDAFQDADAILLRGDLKPMEGTKAGLFFLYQHDDSESQFTTTTFPTVNPNFFTGGPVYEIKRFGQAKYDLYTVGTDGSFTTPTGAGNLFVNWDLIYQGGTIDDVTLFIDPTTRFSDNFDVSAYFLHADIGVNIDKVRLTYTTWYASGDDDDTDTDVDNFMSTDVDMFDSVVLFEGGYTDDNYFTEAPYILNKGLYLNKVAVDYKATDKTSLGAAVLYLMTAEDLPNGDDNLGWEIDAYVSHKLYDNVEVALNAGYLFSDDGMDNFSSTGDADDIFRSTARVRYQF